jgi:quinol monooxygenase YgiN
MQRFVLVVKFTLHPDAADRFMPLIVANAEASLRLEPGCRQFDVTRSREDPNLVLLYEVYDDDAAFDVHRNMDHVKAFFEEAGAMIAGREMIVLDRLFDGTKKLVS